MIFEQRKKRNIHSRARKTYSHLIIERKGKDAPTEQVEKQRKIGMKEKKRGKSKILDLKVKIDGGGSDKINQLIVVIHFRSQQ